MRTKKPSTATNIKFRVLRLAEPLRDAVKKARLDQGLTTRHFVAEAVKSHLPSLVDGLSALGLGTTSGPKRPARLPFADEDGTLDALRKASEAVRIPATQLLCSCLAAAAGQAAPTGTPAKGKRGRGRPAAADKPAGRRRKPKADK